MLYAILMLAAAMAGGFANYLIYSWAYFPRHISPWAPPHPDAPRRHWSDRIPILGWVGLRRESAIHGRGFFIRPMMIEVGCVLLFPLYYGFLTQTNWLLPEDYRNAASIAAFSPWAHSLFAFHAILLTLMIAATFIDFDEQTIPDIITLPGTLLSLLVATLPPRTWLPAKVTWNQAVGIVETHFHIPWPMDLKWQSTRGLWFALAIWSVWCFALADRRVIFRRGLRRAIGYFVHAIQRSPASKWLTGLWAVGTVLTFGIWSVGGDPWRGLFTALIGLAVGGGTVWAVRIVASFAMGQEAMGFGDVTLMAMLGAAIGWQAALAAFFLAPIAAIAIVLVQFLVTRQPAVPFGPYLCAGTAIAVVGWDRVWNQSLGKYVEELGLVALYVLIIALLAMGILLMVWRQIKSRWILSR